MLIKRTLAVIAVTFGLMGASAESSFASRIPGNAQGCDSRCALNIMRMADAYLHYDDPRRKFNNPDTRGPMKGVLKAIMHMAVLNSEIARPPGWLRDAAPRPDKPSSFDYSL